MQTDDTHRAAGGGGAEVRPWVPGEARTLARTPVFDLIEQNWTDPEEGGRTAPFVRIEAPDWVNVVAITPDDRVVLVEQFRFGLGETTLEIPGGMVDAGESAERACERELREETGYAGGPCVLIGSVTPNPALQGNRAFTGLIRGAELAGDPAPDEHERFRVLTVPRREIAGLVRSGRIDHALVVAAFHHLAMLERDAG